MFATLQMQSSKAQGSVQLHSKCQKGSDIDIFPFQLISFPSTYRRCVRSVKNMESAMLSLQRHPADFQIRNQMHKECIPFSVQRHPAEFQIRNQMHAAVSSWTAMSRQGPTRVCHAVTEKVFTDQKPDAQGGVQLDSNVKTGPY